MLFRIKMWKIWASLSDYVQSFKIMRRNNTFSVIHFSMSSLQVLSSTAASSAIAALSPGGILMQAGAQQAINRECVIPSLSDVIYWESWWLLCFNGASEPLSWNATNHWILNCVMCILRTLHRWKKPIIYNNLLKKTNISSF